MKSEYIDKEFRVKDIMERKTFNKKDGSSGSVQKIFNVDDLALTIWDKEDMFDDLASGDKYAVTGIIKRTETYNEKTFDVYHTGKYTVITPLRTRADKEAHYEGKIVKSIDVTDATRKTLVDKLPDDPLIESVIEILANLQRIIAMLQVIKDMI